ncbi:MAG: YeaH/YhbH family protein [Alphaproteobacteria bacterium]
MSLIVPYFVDRRQNPKDKSLGNRQRFMKRARAHIKQVVDKSIRDRSVTDIGGGETVTIPTGGIDEPRMRHDPRGGAHERVYPGNREYQAGDQIEKPPAGGGEGGGKKGSDAGDGEDEFQFVLTREEFLDLFFEDLELPDMVKTTLKEVTNVKPRRSGFAVTGTPTNLDLLRTMKNSFGRRLALRRPKLAEVEAKQAEIEALAEDDPKRADLLAELEVLERRRKVVGFIDPVDLRFRNFENQPQPNSKAVMFCLMDVSGSMGMREKDLAKRFFVLLHLFLSRRYDKTEVVFVRHTHEAKEVDEETFFYSRETGGTVVSTALDEMRRIVAERYPTREWNIYAAQASDGENHSGDDARCMTLLNDVIMPVCQYYAYVEILDERETEIFGNPEYGAALWRAYRSVAENWSNFAMKRIARPADIYPVFRELFAKSDARR